MAHQYDEEPIYMRPYVPGKVVVGRGAFAILCVLATLGAVTLFFIMFS